MNAKQIAVAICLLTTTACSSLQYAGNASYSVSPYKDDNGITTCCKIEIKNGKEIENLEVHVEKRGDDYTVDLKEQGIKAFEGQQIAAGATKEIAETAGKAAATAAIAQVLPLLLPSAGTALASPGLGAAAVGAGAVIAVDKVTP